MNKKQVEDVLATKVKETVKESVGAVLEPLAKSLDMVSELIDVRLAERKRLLILCQSLRERLEKPLDEATIEEIKSALDDAISFAED